MNLGSKNKPAQTTADVRGISSVILEVESL